LFNYLAKDKTANLLYRNNLINIIKDGFIETSKELSKIRINL